MEVVRNEIQATIGPKDNTTIEYTRREAFPAGYFIALQENSMPNDHALVFLAVFGNDRLNINAIFQCPRTDFLFHPSGVNLPVRHQFPLQGHHQRAVRHTQLPDRQKAEPAGAHGFLARGRNCQK